MFYIDEVVLSSEKNVYYNNKKNYHLYSTYYEPDTGVGILHTVTFNFHDDPVRWLLLLFSFYSQRNKGTKGNRLVLNIHLSK